MFPWPKASQEIPELSSIQDFDSLFQQELTVLFKHSPTCPISLYAHREVARFCKDQPEVPVYLISVRKHRDVARHIAERTRIRHESPQILVLRRGTVVGSASHENVSKESIQALLR